MQRYLIEGKSITLAELTPLEWLDLETPPGAIASERMARTVAYGVSDWDGEIPIWQDLQSYTANHGIVAALYELITSQQAELPELTGKKSGTEILITGPGFSAGFRQATILELLDLMEDHAKLPPSRQKIATLCGFLTHWRSPDAPTPTADQLWESREDHSLIRACDIALEPFFRPPIATPIPVGNPEGSDRNEQGPGVTRDPGVATPSTIFVP